MGRYPEVALILVSKFRIETKIFFKQTLLKKAFYPDDHGKLLSQMMHPKTDPYDPEKKKKKLNLYLVTADR